MRDNRVKHFLLVILIQAAPLYANISNPNPTPWESTLPGVSTSTTPPLASTMTSNTNTNTTQPNTPNGSNNTNNSQALTQSALKTFMNLTYQKLSATASQNNFQSEDSSNTDPNFHVFEGHS